MVFLSTRRSRESARKVLAFSAASATLLHPSLVGAATSNTGVARPQPARVKALKRIPETQPRNIVLILTDDHRYDAMGFVNHPFLRTPNLDTLARNGAHLQNAFVTTSLCSPSRASILTGQYAHNHRVVDNNHPVPSNLVFFPQYLQEAGYTTALIGKWHMGHSDDQPQRGFDHWVSFRGQGTYYPHPDGLNVNGKKVAQKGYITDELTDYALEWLASRPRNKPFFLELSHKAVHHEFVPPMRYKGRYAQEPGYRPPTYGYDPDNDGKPMWVKTQRNSWHGVEFPFFYHDGEKKTDELYRNYCESVLAVDDSVGRVLGYLRQNNLMDNTVVLYMGDNGFMWGEHGIIDKRAAYEPSIRVPMLLQAPGLVRGGTVIKEMVANIDVAPTLLEAAGLVAPDQMDGKSFLPLAKGQTIPWRDAFFYEYYWERMFPQTPTCFALRSDRYKYILYHGIWDTDEFFDLLADPHEARNLIRDPSHQARIRDMRARLFKSMRDTNGSFIPLAEDPPGGTIDRTSVGSAPGAFPSYVMKSPPQH